MRTTRSGVLALVLALAAGCGGGEKLYDVSGTVTFDGQPVPAGRVYFDPDPTAGGSGPQGSAAIKDGKFDTAVEGRGVRGGGGYVIRVAAHDGKVSNENPWGQPLRGTEYEFKKELPKERSELMIDVPKPK
ncbi:MAG TPA: hypothetical protein VKE74_23020 [Gemmataceae bacterium]|nr:hypothetical protein [Gemmataceae bacterium]